MTKPLINLDELSPTELVELEQLANGVEAERGLTDLFYLDKYILGYKDMEPRTHLPLCRFVSDKTKRKKHAEYPRGTFKSSGVTIGYTVQSIANDNEIRILIDNEVYGNSKAFLREIKGHLENPRVLELYPGLAPNKRVNEGWTESSVIVSGRKVQRKEPTITCAGTDQIKVGMHYDLIIMDDLVSNKNVSNPEQIKKIIEHYKMAMSLLEPEGELIVLGTRYHYMDLYGHLLENEFELFDHLIIPARLDVPSIKRIEELCPEFAGKIEDGDLLFPERLTEQFLANQLISQGSYIFNCQYLLNPVDQETADFMTSWLRYYKGELKWEGDTPFLTVTWIGDAEKVADPNIIVPFTVELAITNTVDPANKKRKRSDFTTIAVVGTDKSSRWWILNLVRAKLNPGEVVDSIMKQAARFVPEVTGVEETGLSTVIFYLKRRMAELNSFFRLTELKPRGMKKEDRIKRIIPRFENHKVFLPLSIMQKSVGGKEINVVNEFVDEYMFFPLSKHDDLMDALAYQEQVSMYVTKHFKKGKKRVRRKGHATTIR